MVCDEKVVWGKIQNSVESSIFEPSLRLVCGQIQKKLAKYPVFLRVYLGTRVYLGIPGILPISPICVRFCLRSRGKSYHRVIL